MIILRPSSVRSFFETPDKWYRNHILEEDKFEGNTATYLGSVVHKFAESYYNLDDFNPHEILEEAPEGVDKALILAEYPAMCKQLEKKYLSKHGKPELIEHFMKANLTDDIIMQGTCDFYTIENGVGILGDYKTSAKVTKSIDDYTDQLNIYAKLLDLIGRKVDVLRVVNITRETKTISPRVSILECNADIDRGKYLMKFMANKTKLAIDNPQFIELIFSENKYSFLSGHKKIENTYELLT